MPRTASCSARRVLAEIVHGWILLPAAGSRAQTTAKMPGCDRVYDNGFARKVRVRSGLQSGEQVSLARFAGVAQELRRVELRPGSLIQAEPAAGDLETRIPA